MTRRVFETGSVYQRKYCVHAKYSEVVRLCESVQLYMAITSIINPWVSQLPALVQPLPQAYLLEFDYSLFGSHWRW